MTNYFWLEINSGFVVIKTHPRGKVKQLEEEAFLCQGYCEEIGKEY